VRAFWRYDLFPFVLSATVRDMKPADGHLRDYVLVAGFDFCVKPIVMLPDEQGDPIGEALERLRREHADAHRVVDAVFRERLETLAPFMKEVLKP
jgi:hypothetical protein